MAFKAFLIDQQGSEIRGGFVAMDEDRLDPGEVTIQAAYSSVNYKDALAATGVGRIIRRTSIDELPQLWCVLKGEMSLVGPRPPIPKEVARYSLADRARLSVTPGLTCIWQVSGRSEIPFPEQVRMDVRYIREQSLARDVKLLLATIPAVIRGKGAY